MGRKKRKKSQYKPTFQWFSSKKSSSKKLNSKPKKPSSKKSSFEPKNSSSKKCDSAISETLFLVLKTLHLQDVFTLNSSIPDSVFKQICELSEYET